MIHAENLTWTSMFSDISRINRSLPNLLTITRIYTDPVKHDMGTLSALPKEPILNCFGQEYDSYFEYRLMEALRNHVQHHGMPITELSYPQSWVDRGSWVHRGGKSMAAMRYSITARLDVDQITRIRIYHAR
jgi:hypothetical protein